MTFAYDAERPWCVSCLTRRVEFPTSYYCPCCEKEAGEWMQGLPAGWVTDVPGLGRNEQLKALGNGVVSQQCAAALRMLLTEARAAA